MSLAHFIAEAKKHTPVTRQKTVTETKTELEQPQIAQRSEIKKVMAEISEAERVVAQDEIIVPSWKQCQYLKSAGDRELCKQYMSWCVKDKCQKKFMDADFFDFKRHLKQRKPIK